MTSIQQDKDMVLHKADAIQTKWQKMSRRNGGESSTNKVDSWLHLVRDVLTQSKTSLNTIGEEDKRNSFPWKNRLSRSNSVEQISADEVKIRSLPKRASYAEGSTLKMIEDVDESPVKVIKIDKLKDRESFDIKPNVSIIHEDQRSKESSGGSSRVTLKVPVHDISEGSDVSRPKSGISSRISEEEGDARANSIESQSDISEQSDSGSNSRAPSVTFSKTNEYITNYREASSVSVPAPDDVFVEL